MKQDATDLLLVEVHWVYFAPSLNYSNISQNMVFIDTKKLEGDFSILAPQNSQQEMFFRSVEIISHFIQSLCIVMVDSFLLAFLPKGNKNEQSLAVIRLDDIGDFVIWLRAAEDLRIHYKTKKITLVANRSWAELARALPFWDEILVVDVAKFKKNFLYRWEVFTKVRRVGFDMIIQPTYICHLTTGDTVTRISNASIKIGSAGNTQSNRNGWQKRLANRWYTNLIVTAPQPLSVFERNEEFMSNLTCSKYLLRASYIAPIQVLKFLFKPAEKYFLIFPGSNGKYKIWPHDRFATLTSELSLLTGYTPIICGAPSEIDLCDTIAKNVTGATSLAGKTTIIEMVELIRGAIFVVGNDSSAIHIAAATDTMSFCILGGGHYGMFAPYPKNWPGTTPNVINYNMPCYGCGWRCYFSRSTSSPFPCITNISTTSVFSLIKSKLERAKTKV